MIVRKVRGQNKIDKVILLRVEYELAQKLGIPIKQYVKEAVRAVAKKRRWKWYFEEKNT